MECLIIKRGPSPKGGGLTGVNWIAGYGMAAVGDTLYMCTWWPGGPGVPWAIGGNPPPSEPNNHVMIAGPQDS